MFAPLSLVMRSVSFDCNPFFRRQVIMHIAMHAIASSRATASDANAVSLQTEADSPVASSTTS